MLLFWPTSLYEIVLAKGLLLILWLWLVTSCPVMIAAASWHHAAVVRNGHLITGLKQRDGQSLCLKQIWAEFSGAIPRVISCDIHFCAACCDTSLVQQEGPTLQHLHLTAHHRLLLIQQGVRRWQQGNQKGNHYPLVMFCTWRSFALT